MKMTSLAFLIVSVFLSTSALSQTKDGFKGFAWGTDISQMRSPLKLKLHQKTDSVSIYSSNVKSIGSAILKECYASFYKDKFESVMIFCDGFSNTRELLAILKEVYGEEKGDISTSGALTGVYIWQVDQTTATFIKKTEDSAVIYIHSDSLQQVIRADKKKRAQEGAREF